MLKLKRLIAISIDFLIIVIVSSIISSIVLINNVSGVVSIILTIIGIFIYVSVFFGMLITKDIVFGNASIGKKVVGIGIYDKHEKPMLDKKILIKRNLELFPTFPIDVIDVLISNKRRGDIIYNTQVLNTKKQI